MASFLPLIFPGGGNGTIAIPGHDGSLEQRCKYPYTYTSVKCIDEPTSGHHRGSAQGTFGAIKYRDAPAKDGATAMPPAPVSQPKTLAGILIRRMDTLSALYSPEWMAEIEQEFRDTLRSFLAEESVGEVLGKTRCRDCLYYFEKNQVKPSKSRMASLGNFLSFWWGTPVKFGDKVYAWKMSKEQKTAAVVATAPVLTHLDNGTWILT
jgi:hypothetical protein